MKSLQELTSKDVVTPFPQVQEGVTTILRQTTSVTGETEVDKPLDFMEYWRVMVKRKWTLILFFLLVVGVTATANLMTTPIYRATATVQVDRADLKVTNYDNVSPMETGLSDQQFYQTQYELLKSRTLAQRTVEQLRLWGHPVFNKEEQKHEFVNVLFKWLNIQSKNKVNDPEAPQKQFLESFSKSLTIEPIRNSKLIKIHYDLKDPKLAAQIVNTLTENYIKLTLERRYNAAAYAKDFLDQRLVQVKAKLEDAEDKLAKFTRRQGIIDIGEKQTLTMQKLKVISEAMMEAEKDRIDAESKYREANLVQGHGIEKILDNIVINRLKEEQAKLESDYQNKLKIFKPDFPDMQQLRRGITENQKHIEREVEAVRTALRTNYNSTKRKEDLLRSEYTKLESEALRLQGLSSEHNILLREADTSRTLYKGLLKRLKEVGVTAGVSMNNISVIDPAESPINKFKPKILLNVLMSMVFGLIAGVSLVFFLEHLDDLIKIPEDLERSANLPLLGVVPRYQIDTNNELLTYHEPRSMVAEAYRSVRTALLFSTTSGAPKILHFTSSRQGEGKSTTAVNLAITFAQLGHTVLIIDADLRRPSMHKRLGLDNSIGLTNCLTGEAKPEQVTQAVTLPGIKPGLLYLITSGPMPPNPAELLASQGMANLINLAARKFDYVVLDGPPVLGLADALILGSLAQGTIFVTESGSTPRRILLGALKRLRTSKPVIVGGILNKLGQQDSVYSYYNYTNYSNYQLDEVSTS